MVVFRITLKIHPKRLLHLHGLKGMSQQDIQQKLVSFQSVYFFATNCTD